MAFRGGLCSSQPDVAPSALLAGRSADAAARGLLILGYFKPGLARWYGCRQHAAIAGEAGGRSEGLTGARDC